MARPLETPLSIMRRGLRCALVVVLAALLFGTLAACGSDQLTGSWRGDGEKGGRQLILVKHEDSYRIAFPGTGGWLVLEAHGDGHSATLQHNDPADQLPFESERLTVRFDEDRDQLVLLDEYLDADGEPVERIETTFTKVSDSTDGPPWSE